LIAGCHPGECHYVEGNIKALRRYTLLKHMLLQLGIEPERVQIVWAAASESKVLAQTVDRMTLQLQQLGPLRWRQTVLDGDGNDMPVLESTAAPEVVEVADKPVEVSA